MHIGTQGLFYNEQKQKVHHHNYNTTAYITAHSPTAAIHSCPETEQSVQRRVQRVRLSVITHFYHVPGSLQINYRISTLKKTL